MRCFRLLILAVIASVLTGCPPTGTPPKHIHTNRIPKQHDRYPAAHPKTVRTYCKDLVCNREVYIDEHCNVTDASGAEVTELSALIGTRICFFNHAGCTVILKFDEELFGASRARVTLNNGECVNLIVNAEAASNTWLFEVICDCVSGGGHGNPEIKVGGGTEGGGGG